MARRKCMTPELEEQLRREFSCLWNSTNPYFSFTQICEILKIGVPGSPYAKLSEHSVYIRKQYEYNLAKRMSGPRKKTYCTCTQQFHTDNLLQLNEAWQKFDGNWSEFLKSQASEVKVNAV